MSSLESLKKALRQEGQKTASAPNQRKLSNAEYSAGFELLVRGSGWKTYQDFIIPQLSQLLFSLLNTRSSIKVLEIGPGPKSVLGFLPDYLRWKVKEYTAFEPNGLYASELRRWICLPPKRESPLPCLENAPDIHQVPFTPQDEAPSDTRYDVILFCHSMYGMEHEHKVIEQALKMLVEGTQHGSVVVFHCYGALNVGDLVSYRTATFSDGVIRVANKNDVLDKFAPFIAGYVMRDIYTDRLTRGKWREACRRLGSREPDHPEHLSFRSPIIMAAFTQHATALPELTSLVPSLKDKTVKNRETRLHSPASVVRPTNVQQIQQCVQWALKCRVGLTVIGGGHSAHCLWPNVVSIDMSAFKQVHILTADEEKRRIGSHSRSVVVVETGCTAGDIIRKNTKAGLTIPLGARPSVGAGLWLQGGLGHLSRSRGITSDSIIGAVVVNVSSGMIIYVGDVPSQHRPAGATRPDNEADILWALKGAGTNFGIVVSVTFEAYPASTFSIRKWVVPLTKGDDAKSKLSEFDKFSRDLPRDCSADAYLYWDADQLHLGVTMFQSSTAVPTATPVLEPIDTFLGVEADKKVVDCVGLFEADMYVSELHGGHGGGKTSSFKRCLFLKDVGDAKLADCLVAAIRNRPSSRCYLHLLQGGGAISDVAAGATAFGCRDWDFCCVITGVWPRDQDDTDATVLAVRWVYSVAKDLLMSSCRGAYSADLGPDPRDAALVARAFGQNGPRLAELKQKLDPGNILRYACPLLKEPMEPKTPTVIILITGPSGAGKDHCARGFASTLEKCAEKSLRFRIVSISDATKREYAAAVGADTDRLLRDRAYKEHHRLALTKFYREQTLERPWLPSQHFLDTLYFNSDADVLLITGMRDEAPVTAYSHMVPQSRLLDVYIQASSKTRQIRRGSSDGNCNDDNEKVSNSNASDSPNLGYSPSFTFDNNATGNEAVDAFAKNHLLPFLNDDLQHLRSMVRTVSDFPRSGVEFRHLLGIPQQPGGLSLCTSLLESHFTGDWSKMDAIICCESGGFVFASALASRVDVPLVLVRKTGKLPPPTVSVLKTSSHISGDSKEELIEMERDMIPRSGSVVIVDDVLATGETLCAVLQLLIEDGISIDDVSIMVVAEFPVHRGRDLLQQRGFGKVSMQSLLVFGGV